MEGNKDPIMSFLEAAMSITLQPKKEETKDAPSETKEERPASPILKRTLELLTKKIMESGNPESIKIKPKNAKPHSTGVNVTINDNNQAAVEAGVPDVATIPGPVYSSPTMISCVDNVTNNKIASVLTLVFPEDRNMQKTVHNVLLHVLRLRDTPFRGFGSECSARILIDFLFPGLTEGSRVKLGTILFHAFDGF